MVIGKFEVGKLSVAKQCKIVTGMLLLAASPTSASANNLCPRVFPNPDMEIVKVRPLPNDEWGVSYFGPGFAGEQAVTEGNPKFQFGLIDWYRCDVTNPPPPTVQELKEFAKLIQKLGPTDTQYRPLTSKAGNWDEKIAQLAEPSKKPADTPLKSVNEEIEQPPAEFSSGVANVYIVAVAELDNDSGLSKFGLLKRDLIVGSDDITFKSEADATEKIKSINQNIIKTLNVVRQGKFVILTKVP